MNVDASPIYRDSSASLDDRVEGLLDRMTIEEKVAQLSGRMSIDFLGPGGFDVSAARKVISKGLGQVSMATAVGSDALGPIADFLHDLQHYLVEDTRLGIPAICHSEALSGLLHVKAASFPAPLAMAATWEPTLIEEMNSVVREQMRVLGIQQALAPVLDVARDVRWGRVAETYGEDPYLCSAIGAAFVRGLHGSDLRHGVLATGKHFVAYGASERGRNVGPVSLSEQELREVYTPPFEVAIRDAGLASVMSAYNELNGEPCSGSVWVLTTLLREELGFSGFVVSDYGAVAQLSALHATSDGLEAGGVAALAAGLDVELPGTLAFGSRLVAAVEDERISVDLIDQSVRRVLREKFRLGLFEDPYPSLASRPEVFASGAGRGVALEIARRSLVLLANDGLLPLSRDTERIAVIGPNADNLRNLFSGYTPPAGMEIAHAVLHGQGVTMAGLFDADAAAGQGREGATDGGVMDTFVTVTDEASATISQEMRAFYPQTPTVLDAIRLLASDSTLVLYDEGCSVNGVRESIATAVDVAAQADVAIVVLGDKTGWAYDATSGEGRDRTSLGLPGNQADLLAAVCATGTPVVVVLVNGRPMPIPETEPPVRAILEAWQPGAIGGTAIAEAIFGRITPGGRLPITIPRSGGQCPIYYSHKPGASYEQVGAGSNYTDEAGSPAFSFGHGLSYTEFRYENLRTAVSDDYLDATLTVGNTGERRGDEVVQAYLVQRGAQLVQPVKRLVAFTRLELAPGAACRVTFHIPVAQLARCGRDGRRRLEGTTRILVGSSSSEIRLEALVEVPEAAPVAVGRGGYLATVDVVETPSTGWQAAEDG